MDLLAPASCDEDLCEIDDSFRCGPDPYADDFSDEVMCDPADRFLNDDDDDDLNRWHLAPNSSGFLPRDLIKRGEKRKFDSAFILEAWSRRYPGSTHLHDSITSPPASPNLFWRVPTPYFTSCIGIH